jgi:hypothetical protein
MALEFDGPNRYDGTDQSVRVPSRAELHLSGGSFTIEAWFKAKNFSDGSWHWIVSKSQTNSNADYLLGVVNGRLLFQTRNLTNVLHGQGEISIDTWHHVAAVQDVNNGLLYIYLNGELYASKSLTGIPVSTPGSLFIASREAHQTNTPCEVFRGIIHDVRLWKRARTQQEIKEMMRRRLSGSEQGLVGYWPLTEGAGSTANDLTANNNDGELLNNPKWVSIETPIP